MHSIGTLIIGGGVAGASLACSLAERGGGAGDGGQGVAIVDVDVFGKYNSSELNGGGVRCTFAEPVNIRLSLASTRYYLEHAKKFDFRQRGYFWMYDEELWAESKSFLPLVRSFGLPVEEMTPAQVRARLQNRNKPSEKRPNCDVKLQHFPGERHRDGVLAGAGDLAHCFGARTRARARPPQVGRSPCA